MKQTLLINISKEKLHYFEFVKPLEDILKNNGIGFFVKNFKEVNSNDLKKAEKVIICGTSLLDNEFSKPINLKYFNWLKNFDKPVLGICGGMQIIGLMFGSKIKKKTQIGFYYENFSKNFLGLIGKQEVYHLHNHYSNFDKSIFEVYSESQGIQQAVKHKFRQVYGVLFHPEVRQKDLITNFCNR